MAPPEGGGTGRATTLILWRGATRGALVGWLVVLVAAASGAAALSDNSFLTHLTTGRRILDGHLPTTDPYTFTAHGEPWVIQSWFASLLYALTEKVGSGVGLRLMVAVISGVIAAVLWRLTRPARTVVSRLAAVAPAILIGTIAWGARPLIFGLLGFVLVLLVLAEERDPRWLVPVMWVWVNTHGSFPLGLVLVVVYGVGVWCDRGQLAHVRRTFTWCVIGVAVAALNPLGPRILLFPVELLSKQDVLAHMIEWKAPGFTDLWQRIFLVAFIGAMALVPRLPEGRRYRLLLPALVFAALGLTATRNIALASFMLTPLLAVALAGLGTLGARKRARIHTVGCAALACAAVAIVGVRLAGPSFDLSSYPTEAVDWLEDRGRLEPGDRIAARDTVGNYLEFRSRGAFPVFVDDRVDMFPKGVVDDQVELLSGGPEWASVLDRWQIDTVLWEQDQALVSLLTISDDWELARTFTSEDSPTTWVVFTRDGPEAP